MLAHARDEAPNECCGLLLGRDRAIERAVRARNVEQGPTRYRVDPADHFAAIRSARADGLLVVGAYHSHPASAPVPSQSDLEEAAGANFLYVIVSPVDDTIRAFHLDRHGAAVFPECVVMPGPGVREND